MKIRITRPGDDMTEDPINEDEDRKYADIASDHYAEEGRGFLYLDDSGVQYRNSAFIGEISQGGRREQLEKLVVTYDPMTSYVWFSRRKGSDFYMGTRNL